MKKVIITSIFTLLPVIAGAGVLPTNQNSEQNLNIPNQSKNSETNATKFYIGIKAGSNSMFGTFGGDSKNIDSGINFDGTNSGVFTGSMGLDLVKPRIRWELEISNVSAGDIKFEEPYMNSLHGKMGYTTYMVNFVPYFRINDTLSIPLTLGLGGASIDFTDTDDNDLFNLKSDSGFAVNLGVGLDIKVSDHFSIVPEFKYNGIIASTSYKNFYVSGVDNMYITNLQALLGVKITF